MKSVRASLTVRAYRSDQRLVSMIASCFRFNCKRNQLHNRVNQLHNAPTLRADCVCALARMYGEDEKEDEKEPGQRKKGRGRGRERKAQEAGELSTEFSED